MYIHIYIYTYIYIYSIYTRSERNKNMFTAYTSYQHRQLFAGEVRICVCQIRQIPDLHGSVKYLVYDVRL